MKRNVPVNKASSNLDLVTISSHAAISIPLNASFNAGMGASGGMRLVIFVYCKCLAILYRKPSGRFARSLARFSVESFCYRQPVSSPVGSQ